MTGFTIKKALVFLNFKRQRVEVKTLCGTTLIAGQKILPLTFIAKGLLYNGNFRLRLHSNLIAFGQKLGEDIRKGHTTALTKYSLSLGMKALLLIPVIVKVKVFHFKIC